MIKGNNISLRFKDNLILSNFNFEVISGEKVCLSGISGRGKTTLLKLIQGYVLPDVGEVYIDGILLNEKTVNQLRSKIIWIPQNINLPVNKGLQLMELLDISDRRNEVVSFLIQLGLSEEILQQDFQKVSGGQKQRIIISICLSLDKEIILMDEPTSSLDEGAIKQLVATIKSLKGKTILSASHNSTWIKHSDKVIQL
jgi:polar amino acid transport system ATP-binding protein/putative ABC transport system ATP-binding protein